MANFAQKFYAFLDPNVAVNKDGYLVKANGFFDDGNDSTDFYSLNEIESNNQLSALYGSHSNQPDYVGAFSSVLSPSSSDTVADSYGNSTTDQLYQDIIDSTDQQNQAAQSSADRAMEFNAAQANLNRQWQAEQNQKAMDFSERMSNTAYQRAMADMQAAGLNPKLVAQLGGASAPSGVTSAGSTASGSPASIAAANLAPLANVLSTYITGSDAMDRQNNDFAMNGILALFSLFVKMYAGV